MLGLEWKADVYCDVIKCNVELRLWNVVWQSMMKDVNVAKVDETSGGKRHLFDNIFVHSCKVIMHFPKGIRALHSLTLKLAA